MKKYQVACAMIAGVLCLFAMGCAAHRQPLVTPSPIGEAPSLDKLDGGLRGLADVAKKGTNDDVNRYASEHRMVVADGKVKVDITARTNEAVDGLKTQVKETQGEVLTDLANHLYAMVPIANLDKIAALADVWKIGASVPVVSPANMGPK